MLTWSGRSIRARSIRAHGKLYSALENSILLLAPFTFVIVTGLILDT